MMMTKSLFPASAKILTIACLCGAASSTASAEGIEPGLWQMRETVIMNGAATPAQVRTRCLSTEQAGDTAATFTPEYKTPGSNCDRAEFQSTATKLKWRMLCKGQMEMDVSGDFTFDSPKHYTATIQSKGTMGGREVVNTSVAIEGEHQGECQ